MQFGEPTREFLAEISNVFPSQSEQMSKIVNIPKKTSFHTFWPPDMLNAVVEVLLFFCWMSKIVFLKILKEIETDSVFQKKMSFRSLFISMRKKAVLTSLSEIFSQNPKNFVRCDITISRIKWFEVNNHFPQLFFCQRRLLFWQPCRTFPTKNLKKQRKWKFSREIHLVESFSLEGNKAFLTIVPENFGRKMTWFFAQFPKENVS